MFKGSSAVSKPGFQHSFSKKVVAIVVFFPQLISNKDTLHSTIASVSIVSAANFDQNSIVSIHQRATF